MSGEFFDTNVIVYFAAGDPAKAARAAELLAAGGFISVQVLSEFVDVARRKMNLDWPAVEEALGLVRELVEVRPIDVDVHEQAVSLSRRHNLRIYDSMIVAAALLAGCETLYTEDMQHGLVVEDRLRLVNPFA